MGLPLFIAPVESDLSSKTANKAAATSPTRSGIRRHRHDAHERRNGARRAAVRIYGAVQRNLPATAHEHFLPWVESLAQSDQASLNTSQPESRPFREALRDVTRSDDWRRERLEERMTSLFGADWQEMAEEATQRTGPGEERHEGDLGWWSLDPGLRERRARLLAPVSSRFDRSPDGLRAHNRSPPVASLTSQSHDDRHSAANEQARRVAYARLRTRHPRAAGNRLSARNAPSRRGPGVDGLGDRERSLSPEVWDTLLSTLTPDPQPPSAGSSFASAAASQSAGASANTPTTAPDLAEEQAAELQCESGCETSDMELDAADYEHPDFARIRRRREESRQARAQAPAYNVDGPAEGPFARRVEPAGQASSFREPGVAGTPAGLGDYRSNPEHFGTGWSSRVPAMHPVLVHHRETREQQMSSPPIGDAGDDAEARIGQHQDGAGPSRQPTGFGEEEWTGMRRIVRSLARREDIPDEWWAEAGLSRTLPQHETS